MAANMISTCSTSSRSTISTSARWRIRASTSSTRATSSPIPTPRPTTITTRSPRVVAHEYFHNWSGNRVTCRDWFQLSLKEGFTVYRDQGFSADQGSAAVKRIEDVRGLRAAQFPEDAGPLAHPIRPDAYQEISNFYTATIYNKGAEMIRMMRDDPRAGAIPRRHATSISTASTARRRPARISSRAWRRRRRRSDAVPPLVRPGGHAARHRIAATTSRRAAARRSSSRSARRRRRASRTSRRCVLPLRLKLFGAETGAALVERAAGHARPTPSDACVFEGVTERPVLSINRGFSAPVDRRDRPHAPPTSPSSSAHDDDPFARYEAMQQLMLDTLVARRGGAPRRSSPR